MFEGREVQQPVARQLLVLTGRIQPPHGVGRGHAGQHIGRRCRTGTDQLIDAGKAIGIPAIQSRFRAGVAINERTRQSDVACRRVAREVDRVGSVTAHNPLCNGGALRQNHRVVAVLSEHVTHHIARQWQVVRRTRAGQNRTAGQLQHVIAAAHGQIGGQRQRDVLIDEHHVRTGVGQTVRHNRQADVVRNRKVIIRRTTCQNAEARRSQSLTGNVGQSRVIDGPRGVGVPTIQCIRRTGRADRADIVKGVN